MRHSDDDNGSRCTLGSDRRGQLSTFGANSAGKNKRATELARKRRRRSRWRNMLSELSLSSQKKNSCCSFRSPISIATACDTSDLCLGVNLFEKDEATARLESVFDVVCLRLRKLSFRVCSRFSYRMHSPTGPSTRRPRAACTALPSALRGKPSYWYAELLGFRSRRHQF